MDIHGILARLQGVEQNGTRGWTAKCPAHTDNSNSLGISVKEDGTILMQCFASCHIDDVCAALGIQKKDLFPPKTRTGSGGGSGSGESRGSKSDKPSKDDAITLEELARDKGFDPSVLRSWGVKDLPSGGVMIQYFSYDNVLHTRNRLRFALKAKAGSRWSGDKGDPPILYGSWRVKEMREWADFVLLVEGESDSWTGWLHKIPTLGIPGAEMPGKLMLPHVSPYSNVYIWQEPDKAGVDFAQNCVERLVALEYQGHAFIVKGEDVGAKDLNDLHKRFLDDPETFKRRVEKAMAEAIPVDFANLPQSTAKMVAAAKPTEISSDNLTDMGNAERLIAQHGQDIRYCYAWKKWIVWDGSRWCVDGGGMIDRLAELTVRSIYAEAAKAEEKEDRRKLVAHAKKSEDRGKIKAMIDGAKSRVPISPDQLDANPWRINVANGTVNLRDGVLLPHTREDYITKISPVKYDKTAKAPTWFKFLHRAMDANEDLVGFLRRAAGYALTGVTHEDCLFFLYGDGRNGKSKFLDAIQFIMGDYAQTTRAETFLENKFGGGIPNDLAALAGVRYAPTDETGEGKKFAEALIKKVTGGGAMQARFLHSEFFNFTPQFKLFMASNYKPVITGQDVAIWERIHLIPFTVYIPPEERDKELGRKLEREAPGILQWAIEGCLEWQRIGLAAPDAVRMATERYKDEMDRLRDFVNDECVITESASVGITQLWKVYEEWCEVNGEKYPMNRRAFKQQLEKYGVTQDRTKMGRFWRGIGILSEHRASVSVFDGSHKPDNGVNNYATGQLPLSEKPTPVEAKIVGDRRKGEL